LKKIFPFPENPGGKTQKATEGVNFSPVAFLFKLLFGHEKA